MSNEPVTSKYQPISPEELVLGLVYGAGTDVEPVEQLLEDCLQQYSYAVRSIHLSDYFPAMLGKDDFNRETPNATRHLQDMGDNIRRLAESNAALAELAIYLIALERSSLPKPKGRTAWLVRSLRRPEEVQELRRIYGSRFILIGVHSPEPVRQRAAERRRQRWSATGAKRQDVEATADIRRDEDDTEKKYGQAVRDTFCQADFFVDAQSSNQLKSTLPRAVRIIFAEPFEPATRDEQAMYHAFTAGLRSSEMGRQVGAALTTKAGDLVAVGTNDVPSGRGGLYWSPDQPDGRDFAQQPPVDSNTGWQRRVARELLVSMARSDWLKTERVDSVEDELDVTEDNLDKFLKSVRGTRFSSLTEFGRAVHAEMDALTTAARLGHIVEGCTAVVTTFPCHNCTRHLIASGIRRVVYIHPYAKSLARDLHHDALVVDPENPTAVTDKVVFEHFVGVAPRCYPQYFDFGQAKRRTDRGRAMRLNPKEPRPRVLENSGTFSFGGPVVPATHVTQLEVKLITDFDTRLSVIDELELPVPEK